VRFVVGNAALGQVLSEPVIPLIAHTHHHASSGARITGQIVADIPSGLSLTLPQEEELSFIFRTQIVLEMLRISSWNSYVIRRISEHKLLNTFRTYLDVTYCLKGSNSEKNNLYTHEI
jgi:hypothetical protein